MKTREITIDKCLTITTTEGTIMISSSDFLSGQGKPSYWLNHLDQPDNFVGNALSMLFWLSVHCGSVVTVCEHRWRINILAISQSRQHHYCFGGSDTGNKSYKIPRTDCFGYYLVAVCSIRIRCGFIQ